MASDRRIIVAQLPTTITSRTALPPTHCCQGDVLKEGGILMEPAPPGGVRRSESLLFNGAHFMVTLSRDIVTSCVPIGAVAHFLLLSQVQAFALSILSDH